ncbi:MAG: hypothetical protein H6744_02690 [Deltaproteobacteria bacterium]|nr:hypothetical protein [Deltaproteobacteria bacterium]MCB9785580.1 hypothetical protein [Deltaproteobacteria bacterium]
MMNADLDRAREAFLDQLRSGRDEFVDTQGISSYWTTVEREASQVEEPGVIEEWLRQLARDRDRIESIKAQKNAAEQGQFGSDVAAQMLIRLLALLADVEGSLRKRLWFLRNELGAWVYLVGAGVKQKPPPNKKDDDKDKKPTARKASEPKAGAKADRRPTKTKGQ